MFEHFDEQDYIETRVVVGKPPEHIDPVIDGNTVECRPCGRRSLDFKVRAAQDKAPGLERLQHVPLFTTHVEQGLAAGGYVGKQFGYCLDEKRCGHDVLLGVESWGLG